jgi:hypothetical protein
MEWVDLGLKRSRNIAISITGSREKKLRSGFGNENRLAGTTTAVGCHC